MHSDYACANIYKEIVVEKIAIIDIKNIEVARRLFLNRHGAWMSQAAAITDDTQYNALYGLQDEGYVILSKKDEGENRFRAVKQVRPSETGWNVWKGSRRSGK